jgi:hypothetical protein
MTARPANLAMLLHRRGDEASATLDTTCGRLRSFHRTQGSTGSGRHDRRWRPWDHPARPLLQGRQRRIEPAIPGPHDHAATCVAITPVARRVRRPSWRRRLTAVYRRPNRARDADELGGEAWIAELLLGDRPGRIPEAMRVQCDRPVRQPEPCAYILGARDCEALPTPGVTVAEEEGRRVVGSRGEVGLDRRACSVTTAARSTSPLPRTMTPSSYQPARLSCSASKMRQPVESRKAMRARSRSCRSLRTPPASAITRSSSAAASGLGGT